MLVYLVMTNSLLLKTSDSWYGDFPAAMMTSQRVNFPKRWIPWRFRKSLRVTGFKTFQESLSARNIDNYSVFISFIEYHSYIINILLTSCNWYPMFVVEVATFARTISFGNFNDGK